jgi:uncharacterized membrane protein
LGDFLLLPKTFYIFVGMNILLLIFLILVWVVSAAYVIYFDYKTGEFYIPNVILAIIMGPIATLFVVDYKRETKKRTHQLEQNEIESNERHMRWFQTLGLINRQHIPNYWRSIPPPPPISRVERARRERDEAISSAIERIDKNKLKDFKFLRNNVEDRER